MEDYASNSKKSQEKEVKKDPADKKIEKVVTGEVVQKPKGVGRKFKDVFFGGDAKNAVSFVASDVLLPALRNLIVDAITKGIEGLIYGESRSRRGRGPTNYGARYQYQSGGSSPFRPDPRDRLPIGPARGLRQSRHEMNDIVLGTKEEAELVVERLTDIVDQYDVASLADLYELLGLRSSHIDNKWGWTFLGNVQIRQIRQGYLLELPPLEEI